MYATILFECLLCNFSVNNDVICMCCSCKHKYDMKDGSRRKGEGEEWKVSKLILENREYREGRGAANLILGKQCQDIILATTWTTPEFGRCLYVVNDNLQVNIMGEW